ncbi:SCD domain-containing protein [Aphelenchoides besseyi]|nr:SCD domain-containing protein [Aphelenchoides besseyi]
MDDTMVDDGAGVTTPSTGMKLRERKRKQVLMEDEGVEVSPLNWEVDFEGVWGSSLREHCEFIPFDFQNIQPKRTRARPPGRPKGSPNKKRTNPAGTAESELLSSLRSGKNIGRLVDDWIREYENNVDDAIVKILQFFISSTGCKGAVTAIMIKSVEFKNIIANLSDDFDEDCYDYPLVMSGPQWKKFRSLYGDFIMSNIIFDEGFTDYILQLLTGLADSQIRAFRHTATFAAMKFSSAMVDLVVELVELKEKNNQQIETEKTKLKQRGTSERLDALLSTKADLETKIQELCLMIQFVFKSVFTHRYRDTVADVRCICISELGNWMLAYPTLFLEDTYLKYVGWSFYDKIAEVRMKCICLLQPLYERAELISKLELFTSKFKDRIVDMVTDKELDVAVKSCQLLTQIHRAFPALLKLPDCVSIYETVYCANRPLAVAAGEFLNVRVFQGIDEDGRPVDSRTQIHNIVAFFIEGQVHNHSVYLVDALIDTNPVVKDWAVMAEMLLTDEAADTDGQLIDVMVSSVKQAVTGDVPVGRSTGKKGTTAAGKDARLLQEERVRVTEAFIPTLPRLINKFIADQEKVMSLIQLPLYFDLDIYQVGRHDRQLNDLMEALDRVFDQHSDDETLKNVVTVISHFANSTTIGPLTENARTQLIDRIALQFRQSTEEALNEVSRDLDEEDTAKVLVGFSKLDALLIVFELRTVDIWDPVIRMIDNVQRFQCPDIVNKGISLLFHVIAHELLYLAQRNESTTGIARVRRHRDEFLNRIRSIIEMEAFNAFFYLCDMLIFCNMKSTVPNTAIEELFVKLDSRFIGTINTFVVNNVFEVSEEEFERLDQHQQVELTCKRRVVLGHYSKLVMNGMLSIVDTTFVLRYYSKHFNDYGDIFKQMLSRCREMDRLSTAQATIDVLISVYEKERVKQGGNDAVDPTTQEFAELRELAKRFAAFYGSEQSRNREAVAHIHHKGITHALELETQSRPTGRGRRRVAVEHPKNLSFLEILVEFSAKLLRHDKATILKYLMDHSNPPEDYADIEEWEPFLLYKKSLSPA